MAICVFQLGLPLNINGNYGQHKFKVHISKKLAKMANCRPKIGQDATFAPTLNWHNSAIFLGHFLLQGLAWTALG